MAVSIILSKNNDILIFDSNCQKVKLLNAGNSPFLDKDIIEFVKAIPDNEHFVILSEYTDALFRSDFIVIALPTNWLQTEQRLDISAIYETLKLIEEKNPKAIIIIKSTLSYGTMRLFTERFPELKIAYVPEFLREGTAVQDEKNLSRLIIGVYNNNDTIISKVTDLFLSTQRKNVPVLTMNGSEAELVKLYSNAYLAMRIAFFNELDTLAEVNNLNSNKIIKGVSLDPRIGDFYNIPSFGFGGYCLPKDSRELSSVYSDVPSIIIPSIEKSNIIRKQHIVSMIIKHINTINKPNPIIGIYRLTMKRDSDNFREAAVLYILQQLIEMHYTTVIYEPLIATDTYNSVTVIKDLSEFKNRCDIIIANRFSSELCDISNIVYTRDYVEI